MHRLAHYHWLRFLRVLRRLVRANLSAHSIALGVSVGVFLGCTPLLGLHMFGAVFLATVLRASRIAAVLFVWISNPATFVPLYGFNYWLGHRITGREPGLSDYEQVLHRVERLVRDSGLISGMRDAGRELASLGPEALENFLLGCTVAGVLGGALVYLPARWGVEAMRAARERRRIRRAGGA